MMKRAPPGSRARPRWRRRAARRCVGEREAEAGALAHGLGGEEGLEHLRRLACGDARAVVLELAAGSGARRAGTAIRGRRRLRTVRRPRPRASRMACSALSTRFRKACWSRWASARVEGRSAARSRTTSMPETASSFSRSASGLATTSLIERGPLGRVLAREGQQVPHHLARPLRLAHDRVHRGAPRPGRSSRRERSSASPARSPADC